MNVLLRSRRAIRWAWAASLVLCWTFVVVTLGMAAWEKLSPPPPTVVCKEGMTLLPRQSCYFQIEIEVGRSQPDRL